MSDDEVVSAKSSQHQIIGAAGRLNAITVEPEGRRVSYPNLVLVPGFPTAKGGGANSYSTFPALAERIAVAARMRVTTFAFRGIGGSEGNFSLGGWADDLHVAIGEVRRYSGSGELWLAGFGTGGALCIDAAAKDGRIRGVASVGAPADFSDWGSRARDVLNHARLCGAVVDSEFPADMSRWTREFAATSTVRSAERLTSSTSLLVMHGSADESLTSLDARAIADAHQGSELRIIDGGRHHLRHDPRAMAIMIGWLARRGRSTDGATELNLQAR